MATIAETFETARRYHQAGALPQAEQFYRQVLQMDPRHAETLHLLGVVAFQAGNAAAAIDHVHAALTVRPSDGRFFATLGLAQMALHQKEDAVANLRRSVELLPASAEAHFNLALALQQLGQWDQAIFSYQQALQRKPDFVQAFNNLGNIGLEQNQPAKAVEHYQKALRLNPRHASAHGNLGVALRKLGRFQEAVECQRRALSLQPNFAQAHNNLGSLYQDQGQLEQAAACFRESLRHDPQAAEVQLNLGIVLRLQGRLDDALARFRQTVALRPQFAEGHCHLGMALQELGQRQQAEKAFRQALGLKPDHVDAGNRLGVLLQAQGRLDEAAACLRAVLRHHPDCIEAHNNLGNTLSKQSKLEEAADCFRQALRLKPDCAEAYNNLGSLLCGQGNLEEATDCFRQAVKLKPGAADAHVGLAGALHDQGRVSDAIACLKEALKCSSSERYRVNLATCLPIIYPSLAEVESWRQRLAREVQKLRERQLTVDITEEPALPLFYLTYQGGNDRHLQSEIAKLYRAPPAPAFMNVSRDDNGKIRVGLLSSFFKEHTIGHWMRGLTAQLARDKFTVVVLSSGSHRDKAADFFKSHADVFVEIPRHLPEARRLIAEQQLDVLLYTDIGMDPLSYTLAFSRLAPVQCTTLGHPVTTGIETIDYFISTEALESDESCQHYSETLIRLKSLPIYYYKPAIPAEMKGREHFGLAEENHVYACLQSLFKFHPRFDELLGAILRGDPNGILVLSKGRLDHLEKLLRQRFAKTLPDVVDRVRFFPPLSYPEYLNLLAVADVQLDPIPFGGGGTSYDGFALGNPIVTMPSKLLRGRITYALYEQMQVMDCVAASPEQYVEKALRLGHDKCYRDQVRQKILAAHGVLFENSAGVRDLEQFFQKAVLAARQGERTS